MEKRREKIAIRRDFSFKMFKAFKLSLNPFNPVGTNRESYDIREISGPYSNKKCRTISDPARIKNNERNENSVNYFPTSTTYVP